MPTLDALLFNSDQHLTFPDGDFSDRGLAVFQNVVDVLPVAVYVCKAPTGSIVFYNEFAVKLWGRRPNVGDTDERFCGSFRLWRPDGSFMPHDQTPMAVALLEGRSFRSEEVVIERPDGSRIHVLVNIDPIFNKAGQVTGAVNAFHDITPLREAEAVQAKLAAIVEESEETLKAKEAELALIAETTPLILTRCSRDLRFLFANRAAAALLGREPDDIIGRPIAEVMGEKAFSKIMPQIEQVLRGEPVEFEAEIPYPGAGLRWVHVNYLPERDEQGSVVGWVASIVEITKRKMAEQALQQLTETLEERVQERTKQVQELASDLVNVEQSTRHRVSRLLHDDLQQMLFAMNVKLSFLETDGDGKEVIEEVQDIIAQAIDLTRHWAMEFNPTVVEGGELKEILDWLARHMNENYQLQVAINTADSLPINNYEERILIYNTVRELLFNVVKHAGVREAQLVSVVDEEGLTITVCDEGFGFDPATIETERNSLGLANAHEQLRPFGGRMDIDSSPGAGTRISLFLPH